MGGAQSFILLHIFIYCYILVIAMPKTSQAAAADGALQSFKAAFFKAMAHPLRIRLLEALVQDEQSVRDLQLALGVDQPIVSQQLAVLRASNIVVTRKEGVNVRYAVRDPLVGELLQVARRIFENDLAGRQQLLKQLREEAAPPVRASRANAGARPRRRA